MSVWWQWIMFFFSLHKTVALDFICQQITGTYQAKMAALRGLTLSTPQNPTSLLFHSKSTLKRSTAHFPQLPKKASAADRLAQFPAVQLKLILSWCFLNWDLAQKNFRFTSVTPTRCKMCGRLPALSVMFLLFPLFNYTTVSKLTQ